MKLANPLRVIFFLSTYDVVATQLRYSVLENTHFFTYIQFCQMNIIPLLSKPYVNEVTLREQKLPLKCCQPLNIQNAFLKGLDLLIL